MAPKKKGRPVWGGGPKLKAGWCWRLDAAGDVLDGLRRDDTVDVEEGFDRTFDLGHAEDVGRVDARAEVGGGLVLGGGERHNFFDAVDDQPHLSALARGKFDLYYDRSEE